MFRIGDVENCKRQTFLDCKTPHSNGDAEIRACNSGRNTFLRNSSGGVSKKHYRRLFLAPGVPSRDQKGSGNQVREPNEDPKGAQVHPEEPPGRPRGSSAGHFRVCGHLEILSFMLRKSIVFDLWHFTGSGRSRDFPREGPGGVSG